MIDNIDPIPFLIILTVIVAWWLVIGIRDRVKARRARAADVAERVRLLTADRVLLYGMCARMWKASGGEWVVCSRPHEHTGPHYNEWTGDIER